MTYYDRDGKPIDLMTWAKLWETPEYRFVKRTWVKPERLEVVTCWDGFDPYRVNSTGQTFVVALLRCYNGKIVNADERRFDTEAEALAAHDKLVAEIQSELAGGEA